MQSIRQLFETTIAYYEKKEYAAAEKAVEELLQRHPIFSEVTF